MTFHELIYAVAFITPLFSGIVEGKRTGVLGVIAGITVGAVLGIIAVASIRWLFKSVRSHPELGKRKPSLAWTVVVWALCAAMFMFLVAVSVLGVYVTRFVIRYV